ncbi:MAG: endonuclease III [Bacteroidales bacterium]|nr:endonuclease III [Candidatus Sodaliphilus aphodohippi]
MTLKERYAFILKHFAESNPNPETELCYNNPFELLVAVILSAQCTDKRVNMITPTLFRDYPNPEMLSQASVEDIYAHIRSVSYPNSKASHLKGMATMLVNDYGSIIPDSMKELTKLPGVGRKTANVILGIVYNKATIAVDTHVYRVSNRTGLAYGKTPLDVEKILTRNIPAELRFKSHHWILLHGRYICKAQHPDCLNCGIQSACKYYSRKR